MNEIVNTFLLARDIFLSEMHLRQPGYMYNCFEPFAKNKERIEKFKETIDSRYIYQNQLDKAPFQHDRAYRDFKEFSGDQNGNIIITPGLAV